MTFAMTDSTNESPEMTLSSSLSPTTIAAVAATTSSHYPVTTEAWVTYPAPQGASPIPYGDTLSIPASGSGGYPSDTEWSAVRRSFSHSPASGFDLPIHDGGLGSHGYEAPYNYPYHNDFEAAPSPYLDATTGGNSSSSHRRYSRTSDASSSSRARRRYPLSPPPPPPSSASRMSAASKLRSASRASKNNHLNPPATEEERKTRASHNQVEKQYRNRLNAHFEALLNTLPEYMRGGEDEEDDGDRKISKAEVLEMARRHILGLERELTAAEEERDELRESIERFKLYMVRPEGRSGKET
ncbi:putative BHLH domain-containing protein [Seiridium cardinale]